MHILRNFILCSILLFGVRGSILYDSYHGTIISKEDLQRHEKYNTTFWCTNEIEPCDPNEGRRVDGSCNNLEHPTRGATHTPLNRILPPVYDADFEPKKAKSGNDLPLARLVRTSLLSEGRVPSPTFTQLALYELMLITSDTTSVHDTVNFLKWKTYCCTPKGKTDLSCTPNMVPDDDPVLRFSDIRCMNMTRPTTFQSIGCLNNNTIPERVITATPLLDLSSIYGDKLTPLLKERKFEGGLLKYEMENGRIWPPSSDTAANVCESNQKPKETRCLNLPSGSGNTVTAASITAIWFWRLHNKIARDLASANPCWDDDKLFNTARDINIAITLQIFYYELLPLLLGRDNLERDGVISPSIGFRDNYDKNIVPQVSLEYSFVLRWLHTMQDGTLKMYDKDGNYLRQYPALNLTLRTGFLGVDDNIVYITQGSFRQGCANRDYVVDPDLAERALGPLQRALDVFTNDLAKNRLFGLQPYIKYREFCFGNLIRSFDDLIGIMDYETIEILKDVYENVEDIDLIAGIWTERPIEGGFVPSTFYCLVTDQLMRFMVSDRHWYERAERPNAFTLEQLKEVRKASIARVLCDVGDSVTHIQPQAFLRAGTNNQMCSCSEIEEMQFETWKDPRCDNENI